MRNSHHEARLAAWFLAPSLPFLLASLLMAVIG